MRGPIALLLLVACGGSPATPPHAPANDRVRAPADTHATAPVAEPTPSPAPEPARPGGTRCDNLSTADVSVDGMLDEWKGSEVVARVGGVPDAMLSVRCSWDGSALAMAIDVIDDRVVRVGSGRAHEDHVDIAVGGAGLRPLQLTVFPGNTMAKPKIIAPARVQVADSLQPRGFSIEFRATAAQMSLAPATSALDLRVVFHDSDAATGGRDHDVDVVTQLELADRKDLLEDFLRTTHLKRADITLDTLAELEPERAGKERLVAGGTVIGVLTDQFAYVTLPAPPAKIQLLPLGARGQQVIAAVVRQSGNGGSRDVLMLWVVWSGQLSPLGQIEIRKEIGGNVLESEWKVDRGKLVVTPKPAVGFTPQTWNEEPAADADSILLPWDPKVGGTIYTVKGASLDRKDLPAKKHR